MSQELHPVQRAALTRMTPARRLELGMQFIEEMRELRAAMLRTEHPEWPAEKIARALREFVLHAG
jgi:hypothetical protein